MDRTTLQLTTAVASGDPEALAHLYEAWFDRLYAEARRISGGDEAFCLDAVQDAMVRVIKSLPALDTEGQLAAWLLRTVRSCIIDRVRSEQRRRRRDQVPSAAAGQAELDDARLAWVHEQIATLDEPRRSLMHMRHRFGWTLEQIGAAIGVGPSAVDGRLGRVATLLRGRARELLDD